MNRATSSSPLRLAMLGMIPGNGHPYSWAAIINGYDRETMAECPYPVIPVYLGEQPHETVRVEGAQVTHIWTEDPAEAAHVAKASRIPNVVDRPEAVIGEVDAVVITTDDGADHVRRARPFVEAGLPVFVDKPLATTLEELRQFVSWHKAGARLLSSSGLRYAREWRELEGTPWRWITSTTVKTWERYGIHALEPVFALLGPGFETVRAEAEGGTTTVTVTHRCGTKVTLAVLPDTPGGSGVIHAYGVDRQVSVRMSDTYHAFRGQMVAMTDWLHTGEEPYPFGHTVELMAILIAGITSRDKGGCPVTVESVLASL